MSICHARPIILSLFFLFFKEQNFYNYFIKSYAR